MGRPQYKERGRYLPSKAVDSITLVKKLLSDVEEVLNLMWEAFVVRRITNTDVQ